MAPRPDEPDAENDAAEHSVAVEDAGRRLSELAGAGRRPLAALPESFGGDLATLHRVAEETLQAKRRKEAGSGWLRPYTPGGIGAPPWEAGNSSGAPGSVRILGSDLVLVDGAEETRTPLGVDPASTLALSDFQALTTAALAELITAAGAGADPDPIRLWPEHFDVATVLGSEEHGTRANFGGSPGDGDHDLPYLYVGPWSEPPDPEDPFWNARGFRGAELGYEELRRADDQLGAALGFLREGATRVGSISG